MNLLKQIFTWWNGSTWGTRLHIWRTSKLVGEDEFGNTYYLSRKGKRYVQYAGLADASSIPAGWHGWMHYRVDMPPSKEEYQPREWQKAHKPNPTGGPNAYYPKGSLNNPDHPSNAGGDYDAWTP